MRKIALIVVFLAGNFFAQAQLGGIINNAKKKTEEKVNKKVNDEIDDQTDGKEEPAGDTKSDGTTTTEQKPADTTVTKSEVKQESAAIKVYSKYDFVPGDRIVVMEDFMQDAVGDFPAKWNTTSSAEIVTLDGNPGHWMLMTQPGVFIPEFIDTLPDNFTFEFDLFAIHGNKTGGWGTFHASVCELPNRNKPETWQSADNNYYFSVYAGNSTDATIGYGFRKNGESQPSVQIFTKQMADKTKPVHVSMWRQKERMRVYFNEEKVLDLPKALVPGIKYNSIFYYQPSVDEANRYAVSNLRLAVGAPDTRSKLITEGKWVTHGILFDVNSDQIKPESYGTLKEVSTVLKENPDVNVKIVGYTDSDGDATKNLDLSKRRAASVKDVLAKDFGIDAARMQTDGKGEGDPIDSNATPAGKANNRRVEFVKM